MPRMSRNGGARRYIGMSWRQAAERFGVSIVSAVRWYARVRDTGSVAARPRGGDTLSARIEAQADLILKRVEETSAPP